MPAGGGTGVGEGVSVIKEAGVGVAVFGVVDVEVDVAAPAEVGVAVAGVTGVEVFVAETTPPTVTVPFTQDACIDCPFASDKSNPLGTACVLRKAMDELPLALARKTILSSVPLPCAAGRFICATA